METIRLNYGPYSPSRLDTGICGYSFYKQYVDPDRKSRPRTENLPQARGSAVHEVLENITKTLIDNPTHIFNPLREVRQWVTEAINRHPAAYEELPAIVDMCEKYINKPPQLEEGAEVELKIAVKAFNTGERDKFDLPIIQFEECDYDDPEAFVRGRADILQFTDDGSYAIVYDHKTQPNVEDADTFQLGIYAWTIWKKYPHLQGVRTILHFARYGIYSDPYVWTVEDLQKIEDELLTRISIIEGRKTWEATPNSKCQYCPFMAECPVMKEFIEIDPQSGYTRCNVNNFKILGDTHKAVKLAGVLNIMEEAIKTIKGSLREHVKFSQAAISIPGKVYDFQVKEGINWDAVNKNIRKEAYAVFEKHGIDPRDFMGFSATFSNSVWLTENEQLVRELADLFPRKSTSEFGGRKG